jgi:regulator of RNase E activity RraA
VIRDGALVIADDDGVVIWPQERVAELLVKAETRLKQDNERIARLQSQRIDV